MGISIIVPVHDNARELADCLRALGVPAPPGCELVVVDDASSDGSAAVADALGVRVIRLPRNLGAAAARNHGARTTEGEILFFVDSDVVVDADAVARVRATLETRGDLAAVFGSYDAHPRAPGIVSQFRNLLHHYMHQTGNPDAFTFWAGCGAVRRAAFDAVGGFDPRVRGLEDVELGYRLRAAGHRILLDKGLLGTHLKRWTLGSMIRTDIALRAVPWARLVLDGQTTPRDLNLARGQRLSLGLVALGVVSLFLVAYDSRWLALTAFALLAVGLLNRRLYAFFRRVRGTGFALACFPLHLLYFVCGGLGFAYAWLERRLGSRALAAARHEA